MTKSSCKTHLQLYSCKTPFLKHLKVLRLCLLEPFQIGKKRGEGASRGLKDLSQQPRMPIIEAERIMGMVFVNRIHTTKFIVTHMF